MRKSDIVSAIVLLKSNKPRAERDILDELSWTLDYMSIDFKQWNVEVDPAMATQIVNKIGSTKADLSLS